MRVHLITFDISFTLPDLSVTPAAQSSIFRGFYSFTKLKKNVKIKHTLKPPKRVGWELNVTSGAPSIFQSATVLGMSGRDCHEQFSPLIVSILSYLYPLIQDIIARTITPATDADYLIPMKKCLLSKNFQCKIVGRNHMYRFNIIS